MRAFVLIKVHAGEVPEVVKNLRAIEGVTEAHMTLGPYDTDKECATARENMPGGACRPCPPKTN